jgi:hypothetical protein
MELRR